MSNVPESQVSAPELTQEQRATQVTAVLAFAQECLQPLLRRTTGGWRAREYDHLLCSLQVWLGFLRQRLAKHTTALASMVCMPVIPQKLLRWVLQNNPDAPEILAEFDDTPGKVLSCVQVSAYAVTIATDPINPPPGATGDVRALQIVHTYVLRDRAVVDVPVAEVPDIPQVAETTPQPAPVVVDGLVSNVVVDAYLDKILAGHGTGPGERAMHTAWVQRVDLTPQARALIRQRLVSAVQLSLQAPTDLQTLLSYEAHMVLNH